ncbi:MAG: NifU family protein, partial [Mycobacteriaceae bacterium]
MADRPEEPLMASDKEAQWRMAGDRIQTLLDSCAAGGTAAQERAQQLVREVVGLYGAGLERIMEAGDPGLAERLATDDLVASLLLVHGLHPHDVHRRVSDALDRVRPYLGSHGGDVDLLGITDGPQGARVLLAFKGSCKSCPSSAVTLELAVQDAVRAAAPEVSSIEVVPADPGTTGVIPAESLLAPLRSNGHSH